MTNYIPNFLTTVEGFKQLLARVANKLCDCGSREETDVEYHANECEYRKLIEAPR